MGCLRNPKFLIVEFVNEWVLDRVLWLEGWQGEHPSLDKVITAENSSSAATATTGRERREAPNKSIVSSKPFGAKTTTDTHWVV